MKRFPLIFAICLTLVAGDFFSQTRKFSNEFLSIGVGARALGMSNTQIGIVNDVTAGYWNPAGILGVEKGSEIGLMHAEYFAGIAKYDFAGFVKRIDSTQAFAISMLRFGVDDIPNTTELIDAEGNIDFNRITPFSAADYAFLFSYARQWKQKLRLGANFKVIRRVVGDFGNSWGFGLDAGVQYHTGKWQLGAVLRDATSTFNAWNYSLDQNTIDVFQRTGNEVPENGLEITLPKLIVGGGRNFKINENFSVLAAIDLDISTDGERNTLISGDPISVDPHAGFEVGYRNLIFLRGGIGNFQYEQETLDKEVLTFQPNIGVGLNLRRFTLDYAFSDIGDQSIAVKSNIFSLKFRIIS